MRLIIRIFAVAALLLGSATLAPSTALAAPVISGAYIFSASSNCQAILSVTKDVDGNVIDVNINTGGALNGIAGTIRFTPDTGMAALYATSVDGELLLMQGLTSSARLTQGTSSENWAYSNTSTTLTLDGTTYRAAYGKGSGGIVHQFTVVGREESNRCVFLGTFIRK